MLGKKLMVLEKVDFISSCEQRLLVDGLDELCFIVFYFEQLIEFFFGLVDALLKGWYVNKFFLETANLFGLGIFHQTNIFYIIQ